MKPRLLTLAAIVFAILLPHVASAQEIRAVWVTRWEYRNANDVRRIIQNAAMLNFNVVLFQVRGHGTVYYRSQIEPWAWELTSAGPETTGKDPGWDPLAVAIDEARRRGVQLHAWINVFPAWHSQKFPPRNSGQLWWERPDWFMHDAAGRRMIPRDRSVNPKVANWYSFISPGVPEVQDYLAEVCRELVTNYPVHGVHYDYIRYPREIREVEAGYEARAKKLGNWSYDPVSLARFAKETGVSAPDDDPDAWAKWRAQQVTDTVKKMHDAIRGARPGVIITAAVGADPIDSRDGKAQDFLTWLEQGTIDTSITMGYTPDVERFARQTKSVVEQRPSRGWSVAGIGLNSDPEIVIRQIELTRELGSHGFSGFSYGRLADRDKNHALRPLAQALRQGPMSRRVMPAWRAGDTVTARPSN